MASCPLKYTGQEATLRVVSADYDYGPWFTAAYHGTCAGCGEDIVPDDEIRADGEGGYLCADCGEEGK